MKTNLARWIWLGPLALAAAGLLLLAGLWLLSRQPKTDIRTQNPGVENFAAGHVTEGRNAGDTQTLQTTGTVAYESPVRRTTSPTTNAVGIRWKQHGAPDAAELEVRVLSGSKWTDWVAVDTNDDKKDGTPPEDQAGLVLTSHAKAVQYRFKLNGNGHPVAVTKPELALIDSTRGPDPTKARGLAGLFGRPAQADADGPRVFSRAEWGCPQATSSPGWTPNYWNPLRRVIIHHTVTAGDPGNSAAEVRGIWQFHTYTNGWGDIGYNYLVDKNGNIFQGRYFNPADSAIYGEVEGGHAYGFNDYSIGIAALGNYQSQGTTSGLLDGIGNVVGWRMAHYGIGPWDQYLDEGVPSGSPDGTPARGPRGQYRLAGHRDYLSTSCPGWNLYTQLDTLRNVTTGWLNYYSRWRQFNYSYQGQGVNGSPANAVSLRPGQTATAYLDLRNEGTETWHSDGANPVRLGTNRPHDRASGFRDSSWLSPNRIGTFSGKVVSGSVTPSTTIAPGETARFPFTFGNQGAASGTYLEYFQPVVEGYTWFVRDLGVYWQLTSVGDVYSYQWMGQTYGVPTEPGQTGTVQVDAKNTGNVSWHSDGANPVRLGTDRSHDRSSNLRHSSWIGTNRPATFSGRVEGNGSVTATTTIAPGETARFPFTAQAPTHPFVGKEYFNLLAEGRAWMNDVGMYWPVNIPQNYHAQWVGQSAAPTISRAGGGIGSMSFDFKNAGTYPWRKGQIVHLGTANPLDRASRFFASGLSGGQLPTDTANWDSANRTGSFAGKVSGGTFDNTATVINPGETGRFTVALDARTVNPGTYREYVRPVADGFAWLEDYGVFLPVTVTP